MEAREGGRRDGAGEQGSVYYYCHVLAVLRAGGRPLE